MNEPVVSVTDNFHLIWNDKKKQDFLNIIKGIKPRNGYTEFCSFHVDYYDFSDYQYKTIAARSDSESKVFPDADQFHTPDQMIINVFPNTCDSACPAQNAHDCPMCIFNGKCTSPFVRKYIGKFLFKDKYVKSR
jgi:hypothetical protein